MAEASMAQPGRRIYTVTLNGDWEEYWTTPRFLASSTRWDSSGQSLKIGRVDFRSQRYVWPSKEPAGVRT